MSRSIGFSAAVGLVAALSWHCSVFAAPMAGSEANAPGGDDADDAAEAPSANPAALASPPPGAQAAKGAASAAAARDPAAEPDAQRRLKDAAKPVFEELSHSAVAEAVRSLDTGLQAGSDAGLDEADENSPRRDPGARQRNWSGANADSPAGTPRSAQESEADKAKASVMLRALIDDVKPWALAAAALYLFGHLAKALWGYRRRAMLRKMERRKHRRRRI